MGRGSAKTGGAGKGLFVKGASVKGSTNKTAPAKKLRGANNDNGDDDADADAFASSDAFVRLDGKRPSKNDDEEEEDEEVFDLAGSDFGSDDDDDDDDDDDGSDEEDGDDDQDDDEDDNEDSEADEDEDDDDDDDPNNYGPLVEALAPELRQRFFGGNAHLSDDDDDDDDDEEEDNRGSSRDKGWGSRKMYHGGDTGDLEIGQDRQDAFDEEEAALEMQSDKLSRMQEADFFEDFGDDDEDEDDEDEEEGYATAKRKGKQPAIMDSLESAILGRKDVHVEKLVRDPSQLSRAERLRILAAQSPEMLPLVEELQEALRFIEEVVDPMRARLGRHAVLSTTRRGKGNGKEKQTSAPESASDTLQLRQYIEAKAALLDCYSVNILFYLTLRASGADTQKHPVMRQLLEIRYGLQKMEFADRLYKREIEGWLQEDVGDGDGLEGESDDDDDDDNDEDEDEEGDDFDGGEGDEEDDDMEVNEEDEEQALQDDEDAYTYTPHSHSKSSKVKAKPSKTRLPSASVMDYGEYEDERDNVTSRKASRGEGLDKLTSALQAFAAANGKKTRHNEAASGKAATSRNTATDDSLDDLFDPKASKLNAAGGKGGKKRLADQQLDDEYDDDDGDDRDGFAALLFAKGSSKGQGSGFVRRPAPSMGQDDDDMDGFDFDNSTGRGGKDGKQGKEGKLKGSKKKVKSVDFSDDLLEKFSATKKDFLQKKQDHYTPAPRFGGFEENVDEGKKRAATYEMIKNKGLTPHRKKANRNPRVKKRLMYAKAVVARKGQVREVTNESGQGYGGELTGIKANIARSRKIAT